MTVYGDHLSQILKAGKCRVTKPRLLVFEKLYGREPLSMNELIKQVPKADRASIYRTVELFEKLGIAQKVYIGWKYKIELTDKFAAHHHHLSCINCGKTIPIDQNDLEKFVFDIARQHNFKPTTHQIELQGYCSNCQKLIALDS